jgi:LysR family positive regulator for ilvC
VTAAYSHLPPILDRRAAHPSVEIKLTTGDAADAMEKVVTGSRSGDCRKPETLPGGGVFDAGDLAVVLIAPALCRCVTRCRRSRLVNGAVYHGRSGPVRPH